jgi:hypothetical protein
VSSTKTGAPDLVRALLRQLVDEPPSERNRLALHSPCRLLGAANNAEPIPPRGSEERDWLV